MRVETGIIKGKKTTYSRADGSKVVKHSKTINLGVNSVFDCGTNVVVIAETDYNSIINSNNNSIKANETIEQLNNTISDNEATINNLTNEVAELKNEVLNSSEANSKNLETINKLEANNKATELELTDIKRVMKQHNVTNADGLQQVFKLWELLEKDYIRAIGYLNQYNNLMQQRGLIQRITNKDVTDDIGEPVLNYIDLQGNKLNNNTGIISINDNSNSNKSE